MRRSSRVGRVGRVTMEGYGHLPLPASSSSLASPQFGPEQRIYRMYRSCWTKHNTGRRNQFHVTINWLSRIVMMLTRTVFWIYLWNFGKRNFDILPLFSATLPAEVELFYKWPLQFSWMASWWWLSVQLSLGWTRPQIDIAVFSRIWQTSGLVRGVRERGLSST